MGGEDQQKKMASSFNGYEEQENEEKEETEKKGKE